jgi:hypothetical protein
MKAEREGNRPHSFNSHCNLVSFIDFIVLIYVALIANLEAANKVLDEEKASWQVVDQALQASQESNSALNRDLQFVRVSTDTLKEELEAARASTTAAR